MQIVVNSMVEIKNISYELQRYCEKELTFYNPEYVSRKQKRQPVFNIEKHIKAYIYDGATGSMFVPKGFLNNVISIVGTDVDITYTHKTFDDVNFGWNEQWQLRDYQESALMDIHAESGILVAPAGSGKTIMALRYIDLIDKPAVWLVHTTDLMYQARDRAQKVLLLSGEIGLLGAGHNSFGDKKLLIANFQTLQRSKELIRIINNNYSVLIIDEAHHVPSNMFMDVVCTLNMEYMLGVTATPDRKDKCEFLMYLAIGKQLHEVDRQQLYNDNQLVKPEVKFIYTDFVDEQTSKTNSNDSVNAGGENLDYGYLLHKLYSDEDRVELIVNNIFNELSPTNFQLVLSESIDYAYKLQKRLIEMIDDNGLRGIETVLVHGGLVRYNWMVIESKNKAEEMIEDGLALDYKFDKRAKRWKVKIENYSAEEFRDRQITKKERQAILQTVVNRKIHVLFATKLAKEGLDIPHLNIGHTVSPKRGDANNRRDGSSIEQEIGRIMRLDPLNKEKKATWYDYVDNQCGIFKTHYYTRRKVYKRLDLPLPRKLKTKMESVEEFLNKNNLFV